MFGTLSSADAFPRLNQYLVDRNFPEFDKALASEDWSPNELNSALIAAAGLNLPIQARSLILAGADPNFTVLGNSALNVASRHGSSLAMKVLLESGADPDISAMFDWRPLHSAVGRTWVNLSSMEVLIRHGADINALTNLQITPLHRAAGFCQYTAVALLLDYGANPDLLDNYGQTAAMRASKAGCENVANLIDKKR